MDVRILRRMPQSVEVEIPAALAGRYGAAKSLVFSDWRAASRAFSKELRRIKRESLHDRWGTCPLKADLTPVYQGHSKTRWDHAPKKYKTFSGQ